MSKANKTKLEIISQTFKVSTGDVSVYVYLHDGYIEIVDEDGDKKEYVFKGKDLPKKRELWLNVLKTLETAIKLVPDQKGNK